MGPLTIANITDVEISPHRDIAIPIL